MKKFIYTFIAALVAFSSVASAQDLLRYNYKKNGYVYTGTERIRIPGSSTVLDFARAVGSSWIS